MKSPLKMGETQTNEKELASFVLHTATFAERQAIKAGEAAKDRLERKQETAQAAADEIKKLK
jgi:hypothetical protein